VTSAILSACNPWAFGTAMNETEASPRCYARLGSYLIGSTPSGVASYVVATNGAWGAMHASRDVPRECTDMPHVTR
jgi:hypothetical protein